MSAGNDRERDPRARAELEAVTEIGKALTSTLELPQVLDRILEQVSRLLRPRRWSMLLMEPGEERLRFQIVVGEGAEVLQGTFCDLGEGVAGWAALHGEPVLIQDVRRDARWSSRFDDTTGLTTRSLLAVPLHVRGRVLGLIELVGSPDDPPFDADDLRVLSYIADYAAIALDNARNYQAVQALSNRDEHTGLFNVRYLHRLLDMEVRRTRRYLHPFSLVFLDLDHFKAVNDTHGHPVGSALLAEVGEVLTASSRTTDVACRYGGDEFVVLLPETGRDEALAAARRMREAINARVFLQARDLALRVTGSFGVATFPDDALDPVDLLRRADMAMYAAKAAGRDGIRAAHELPGAGGPGRPASGGAS